MRAEPGSLAFRASHDALTTLPNRACLQERLASLHHSAKKHGATYSLLLLDLDHFKVVNDRFGHATGDQVLVQVGRRIVRNLREPNSVGRWGGEEFLCLLPEVNRPAAEKIAERIRVGIEAWPVEFQGRRIPVTSSIGVATFPNDGRHPDVLLAKADTALYEAKRAGRNRIRSIRGQVGNMFETARIIEKSLREDRVRPAYQAVVDLVSGEVRGTQAMARVELDDHRVMEAASFIPAAEQLHLVHRIDHRILLDAIMRCTTRGPNDKPTPAMFVNISADFLHHSDLVEEIRATLERQCVRSGDGRDDVNPLVIEITERRFMDDTKTANEWLQPLLDAGVRIAIDDFGGGASSLGYLIELPISFIKLEGTLVRRVRHERRVRSILKGIRQLASDLGITTVAEGIENQETLEVLREIGVDWGQGFYFSRPAIQPRQGPGNRMITR